MDEGIEFHEKVHVSDSPLWSLFPFGQHFRARIRVRAGWVEFTPCSFHGTHQPRVNLRLHESADALRLNHAMVTEGVMRLPLCSLTLVGVRDRLRTVSGTECDACGAAVPSRFCRCLTRVVLAPAGVGASTKCQNIHLQTKSVESATELQQLLQNAMEEAAAAAAGSEGRSANTTARDLGDAMRNRGIEGVTGREGASEESDSSDSVVMIYPDSAALPMHTQPHSIPTFTIDNYGNLVMQPAAATADRLFNTRAAVVSLPAQLQPHPVQQLRLQPPLFALDDQGNLVLQQLHSEDASAPTVDDLPIDAMPTFSMDESGNLVLQEMPVAAAASAETCAAADALPTELQLLQIVQQEWATPVFTLDDNGNLVLQQQPVAAAAEDSLLAQPMEPPFSCDEDVPPTGNFDAEAEYRAYRMFARRFEQLAVVVVQKRPETRYRLMEIMQGIVDAADAENIA